jgi:cation transport ATPase
VEGRKVLIGNQRFLAETSVSEDGLASRAEELAPILAAAAMALSSVTVLTDALRLRRVKVS